jgi:hypothetical protein
MPSPGLVRRAWVLPSAAISCVLLSACGSGSPGPVVTVTQTSGAPVSSSAGTGPAAAVPPAIIAVTTSGALVTLNPTTGIVTRTLVARHVLGDELSVSSTGMVYFAVAQGCSSEVDGIPVSGGAVAEITQGSLPAVSPDGTKLAYASEPDLSPGCVPANQDLVGLYHLEVRTLSTGSDVTYPMEPTGQNAGLPAPISHLSWSADGHHLAVSVAAIQDNEGWNVVIVDTAQAHYYLTGAGTSYLPATGAPTPRRSYLREAVYLPNGDLFVSRACCAGLPVRNTSRLMWEVSAAGTLVHQVAIGFPNLDHTSLDASPDRRWLLYLAGHDLYVSRGGATPSKLTSGLVAAAWG